MRTQSPSDLAGTYGATMQASTNNTNICTHWKGLSPYDIQLGLDFIKSTQNSTAATPNIALNSQKCYLTDVVHKHTWRNNLAGGESEIQFYVLKPRRDLPHVFGTVGGTATSPSLIGPLVTSDFSTGGMNNSPAMWGNAIADESKNVAALPNINNGGTDYSPYWSQEMCSLFKIKPLKVNGPNGKSSKIRLQPGQECFYEGKYKGPYMVSFTKYGMDSTAGAMQLKNLYNCLKETPIIFCVHRGSVVHDATTNTIIGIGPIQVDYFQQFKLKIYYMPNNLKFQNNVTTGVGTVASAKQTAVVTAAPMIDQPDP